MDDTKAEVNRCLYCGKPLSNKRQKYCSNAHRMRYRRHGQSPNYGEHETAQATAQTNALAVVNQQLISAESERDKALAIASVIGEERDRLLAERNKLRDTLEQERIQKAVLESEKSALETRIGQLTAPKPAPAAEPLPLWAWVAIVVVVVVGLAVLVFAVLVATGAV